MHHPTSAKMMICLGCLLLSLTTASSFPSSAHAVPSPVTTEQINDAIDRGLQYLHQTMEQPSADTGYWNVAYPEATAATAVLAFEVQGHLPSRNRITDPYVDTVRRGLNYLFTTLRQQSIDPQPAGNPDGNENGYGLYVAVSESNVTLYTTGIALMALGASGTPDATVTVGGDGVQGRTYRDIAQDMVDYLAWAQTDAPDTVRGGWRYQPNQRDSDMSVTQWPVLGMEAAATNLGVGVPEWVKTELQDHFLAYAQGSDGGFGYTAPGAGNVARTGAGLIGLAFAGIPADDERVRQAIGFIGQNWDVDNLGNFYAMYGVMKGSKLTQPEIIHYGDHNWYDEYADYLVTQQAVDGSWAESHYSRGNVPLATAWAVLILSPSVFTAIRLPPLPIWLFFLIPLALLSGLFFLLWRKRRRLEPRRITRPVVRRPISGPAWGQEEERPGIGGADVTHGRGKKRPGKAGRR